MADSGRRSTPAPTGGAPRVRRGSRWPWLRLLKVGCVGRTTPRWSTRSGARESFYHLEYPEREPVLPDDRAFDARCGVDCRGYQPLNSGGRRSAKAARPSRQSSVPVTSSWAAASSHRAVVRSDSRARLVRYLVALIARVGALASRSAHAPASAIS